ncbi:MAG: D-2-hydroxyacid dehydrogenase [Desulfobacteraceae bacterium]|nr:D-2-hydroxyacid dehydrogenase [Desulfobacteraceae bacterium]
MKQVLINFDFPEEYVAQLREKYPELKFVHTTDKDVAFSYLADTHILITFFQCSRQIVDAAPNLEWIQAITAGVDYMPLDAIFERNIRLTNGRGIHRIHMAEYAISVLVMLARNLHLIFRSQFRRTWDPSPHQGEIYGATLGIVGLGEIGEEIAKKAAVFGMRIIGVRRTPEPVEHVETVYGPQDMETVFSQSDYVINLLPATAETENLIDRRFFAQMKPDACFINMGRGRSVNEDDLAEALQTEKIRAAVSDVFYTEPLPETSPLWDLENMIITPHVCGRSPNYMNRAMEIIDHNLGVYTTGRGEMINVVPPDTRY